MSESQNVFLALTAEGDEIDRLVSDLDSAQWMSPTPAPGWTVKHQIAHLAAIFRMAGLAAGDPTAFRTMIGRLSDDFDANVDAALAPYFADSPEVLLGRWRKELKTATEALAARAPEDVVPWLVRPLPPSVLAAAGLMELFGHGQDIADALAVRRNRTDRIRHLCAFATRTWDFGYLARGLAVPDVEFRYRLAAPSGELWTFGPADAAQTISGPAEDLCLLVTRRRHPDDLGLSATGAEANHWLTIAQAYRGPAGPGRAPGQFAAARPPGS
ncbi:TIGR03084 family metal-binding protein [Amycolatopsis saalfeldensis]|uniref:TIGR03084 family protein n=1 Tax=Amycolatopsis saalfeldensis TaxID=394193 RepID=A0A1H8YJT7_9PSEU|nr:TIGR03084 family metal-binding protein [Amycolatopsis saalfeldensis]SEP52407.1 TIGR03084 family protein [Amycolatopsis saalfeldensis]